MENFCPNKSLLVPCSPELASLPAFRAPSPLPRDVFTPPLLARDTYNTPPQNRNQSAGESSIPPPPPSSDGAPLPPPPPPPPAGGAPAPKKPKGGVMVMGAIDLDRSRLKKVNLQRRGSTGSVPLVHMLVFCLFME